MISPNPVPVTDPCLPASRRANRDGMSRGALIKVTGVQRLGRGAVKRGWSAARPARRLRRQISWLRFVAEDEPCCRSRRLNRRPHCPRQSAWRARR
jgi:hypothetical protein